MDSGGRWDINAAKNASATHTFPLVDLWLQRVHIAFRPYCVGRCEVSISAMPADALRSLRIGPSVYG
eukprot:scaffold284242_cov30-Tisochrysis_lutea.AAC.1